MLVLTVEEKEFYDEAFGKFVYSPRTTLELEHSLRSLSKWESKWHTAFLGKSEKTLSQILDYVRCMTIKPSSVDDLVYSALTEENFQTINSYINDKMSATTFNADNQRPSNEIYTSELIYYWMIAFSIPFECQNWHLNRLLTLIRICSIKAQPPKKMSKNEVMTRQRALNAQRRAATGSLG